MKSPIFIYKISMSLNVPVLHQEPTMAAHSFVLANIHCTRMPVMSRAALNRDYKMRVPYELKQGQCRLFHELPSGLSMEVIFQKGLKLKDPDEENHYPPLVFIHGSFHAAWCWAEHWLPFFSNHGYDCYALSLLGQVCPLSLLNFIILHFHSNT